MNTIYARLSAGTTLIACLLNTPISAAEDDHKDHHGDSHNFIQLNYVVEQPAKEDVEPNGAGLLLRWGVTDTVFVRVELEDLEDKGVEVDGQELAIAYILNPQSPVEYHLAAVISHEDESEDLENYHDLSKGVELGFHAALPHNLMLHGEIANVYSDGDHTVEASIGLFYRFQKSTGVNVEWGIDEDSNKALEIGFRYFFN